MANASAEVVKAYLESKGRHPQQIREDLLKCNWQTDNLTFSIVMQFIESGDGHMRVHLQGMDYLHVPKQKQEDIGFYKVMNRMNLGYRNVKFYIDDDGDLNASDDDVIQLDTAGEETEELMGTMVAVVDATYPEFMKAIWA